MTRVDQADARRARLTLVALLVVCGAYLAILGPRDWIPHDDGAMAHAAERVLAGEVPHRDFNEPYTGGLSYLNAGAMALFGVQLVSMRWLLLLFSLCFIAALFRLAAAAASPGVAAAVTLVAFVWSLPNYFAPLPSWYNLFFATFGTLALFRYVEAPQRRWLVVAGAMGGLSILCKIVGLYYLAAVLLVLVYCEQNEIRRSGFGSTSGSFFRVFCVAGLSMFAGVVVLLVSNRLTPLSALLFIVPSCSLAGFLIVQGLQASRRSTERSLASLVSNIGWVCGAALAVIGVYLVIHVATASLDDFWSGTVSVVLRRLDYTGAPLPDLSTIVAALPFLAVFFAGFFVQRAREPWPLIAAVGVLGCVGLAFGAEPAVYRGAWYAVRPLAPILVVAAVVALDERLEARRAAQLFILAAMASLLSLVQFPFSGGVYFCYVAPILIVLGLHVARATPAPPVRSLVLLAGLFSIFAVSWLHSGATYLLGYGYQRVHANVRLDLPRGGIFVRKHDALLYRELVERIQRHTEEGETLYAAPDMPELYFLSARRNPTRSFFDSTDVDYLDSEARDARIIDELLRKDVAFAVLGGASEFSRSASPGVQAFLRERLPNEERMAGLLLRWR